MGTVSAKSRSCAVGLASLLATIDFLLWGGAFTMHEYASTFASEEIRYVYTIPSMTVLGLLLIVGPVIFNRCRRFVPTVTAAGAACMIVSDVLLCVLHVTGMRSLVALAAAGIIVGIGIALSLLVWRGILARFSYGEQVSVVSIACLTFPFVPLVFAFVRSAWTFAVVAALTAASLVCARGALETPADLRDARACDDLPRAFVNLLQESLSAVLCLVSLGFVAGILRTSALSAEDSSAGIMMGSLVCMFAIALALLVAWRVFKVHLSVVRFYQAGFALTATILVASLALTHGFTSTLACFPYLLFEFALVIVMVEGSDCATVAGSNSLAAFGVQTGCAYLAMAAGTALGLFLCRGEGSVSSVFGVTVALCVYLLSVPLIVMLRRRAEGQVAAANPTPASFEPRDIYAERVRVLSEECGLTPREEQIVVLTVCGLDSPAIAHSLSVSDNTVRTHKRNAYKKLGVHSKQDILRLVSDENQEQLDTRSAQAPSSR